MGIMAVSARLASTARTKAAGPSSGLSKPRSCLAWARAASSAVSIQPRTVSLSWVPVYTTLLVT